MKLGSFIIGTTLLLAGCGTVSKLASVPAPASGPAIRRGAQSVSLSDDQRRIANEGVREMVAKVTANGGESAKLVAMRAFVLRPNGGVHVCGDVNFQMEPGKALLVAPYYIELEKLDGLPAAKRGQVGFDELKKSKVTFMCRHLSTL